MNTPIHVTGIGIVSSIGIGRDEFFAAVRAGRRRSGKIEDFCIEDYLETEKTYLDHCSAFALAACAMALKDAQLPPSCIHHPSASSGICLGTALGCLQTMEDFFLRVIEKGPRYANSLLFSHSYANSPTILAAIEFGLAGYHSTATSGESSSLIALMQSLNALRLGYAERIVTGGVDALSEALQRVWAQIYPDRMPGEGAAVFVLETETAVVERGLQPAAFPRIVVQSAHCDGASPAADSIERDIGFVVGAMDAFNTATAMGELEDAASKQVAALSNSTPQYQILLSRD